MGAGTAKDLVVSSDQDVSAVAVTSVQRQAGGAYGNEKLLENSQAVSDLWKGMVPCASGFGLSKLNFIPLAPPWLPQLHSVVGHSTHVRVLPGARRKPNPMLSLIELSYTL